MDEFWAGWGYADGAFKAEFAGEDLRFLRASIRVAEEVGRELGRGTLLQRRVPNGQAGRGPGEGGNEGVKRRLSFAACRPNSPTWPRPVRLEA